MITVLDTENTMRKVSFFALRSVAVGRQKTRITKEWMVLDSLVRRLDRGELFLL